MAVWARLATLFEASLRVPPLFFVDELLKLSLGLPVPAAEPDAPNGSDGASTIAAIVQTVADNVTLSGAAQLAAAQVEDSFYYDADFLKALLYTFAKFIVCCCGNFSPCLFCYVNICRRLRTGLLYVLSDSFTR